MKFLIASFLAVAAISSNGQTVTNKTITLDPYLSFQNYEHFKRLTLSSTDSPIDYLDDFEFSWGYNYQLSVRETELSPGLSDGTQFQYALNTIISKTKVPDSTQFNLFIDVNRYYHKLDSSEEEMTITLKRLNDSTYLYFDKVEIEVPGYLRETFNEILKGKVTKLGTFIFIDDKRIRLIQL